jgi:hypothetical protein
VVMLAVRIVTISCSAHRTLRTALESRSTDVAPLWRRCVWACASCTG